MFLQHCYVKYILLHLMGDTDSCVAEISSYDSQCLKMIENSVEISVFLSILEDACNGISSSSA